MIFFSALSKNVSLSMHLLFSYKFEPILSQCPIQMTAKKYNEIFFLCFVNILSFVIYRSVYKLLLA